MFTLPSLPTDNLYKFVFLAGLVLLIYSFYAQDNYTNNLVNINKSLDSLKTTVAEQTRGNSVYVDRKSESVNELTSMVNRDLADLNKLTEANKTGSKTFKALYNKIESSQINLLIAQRNLDSTRNMLGKASVDFEIEMTRLVTQKVYDELRSRQHQIYFWIGLITFIIGAFSWLFVVQLPQDELNRIQLKLAKLELIKQTSLPIVPISLPDRESSE